MKRVCLYHGVDLDGFCGGAIYDKYWSSKSNQGEDYEGHEIIPMNYGWEVPWEKLEGAEVTLIDFCLQPWGDMNKLLEMAERVLLIDHHQTTIENYRRMTTCNVQKLNVVLDDQFSGCELAWFYFYSEDTMPEAVKLLGRYDVWDHSDSRVLPFQYGMKNHDMRPDKGEDKDLWRRLLSKVGEEDIGWIVPVGKTIIKYQSRQDEIGSKSSAFEIQWEGLTWIAANSGMGRGSHFFDAVYNPEVHDAMMSFHFNGKEWKFAVYTTKPRIQLGQIAKKYGGGGHNKAAGFSQAEVPFDWKDIVPLSNGRKSDGKD